MTTATANLDLVDIAETNASNNVRPCWKARAVKLAIVAGKLTLTALLLRIVLSNAGISEAWARGANIELGYLATIAAIFALHVLASGLRWHDIAGIYLLRKPVSWFTRASAVAYFFNQIMLGTVGGDAYRVIAMRQIGYSLGHAGSVVLIERISTLLVATVLALAALPFIGHATGNATYHLLAGAGTAAVLLGLLTAWSVASHDIWRRIIPWYRLHAILQQLSNALVLSLRQVRPVLCSLFILFTGMLIYWLAARGLGYATPLGLYLMVAPVAMLISMIPITIGGWGAREMAFGTGLALLGGSYAEGVIVSAFVGVLMLATGLPGFVLLMMQRLHGEKADQ